LSVTTAAGSFFFPLSSLFVLRSLSFPESSRVLALLSPLLEPAVVLEGSFVELSVPSVSVRFIGGGSEAIVGGGVDEDGGGGGGEVGTGEVEIRQGQRRTKVLFFFF